MPTKARAFAEQARTPMMELPSSRVAGIAFIFALGVVIAAFAVLLPGYPGIISIYN